MKSLLALVLLAPAVLAQGPNLSYLVDPATELSFAECHVYLDGGSRHKIPFLPAIASDGAPAGAAHYTRDIHVKAPIAFAGTGAVPASLDVAGKVLLLAYDFSSDPAMRAEQRVRDVAGRKPAAIVLFSGRDEHPFPVLTGEPPDIPIVAISRQDAGVILSAAGRDPAQIATLPAEILIAKLDLRIDAKFRFIETSHLNFAFQPRGISPEAAQALADTGDKAVRFDLELFREIQPHWAKTLTVYFADFDSKLFYRHHWGKGLSSSDGVYMVFDGQAPDLGLAAHEAAHTLIAQNWGGSSSFLSEGLGKYAEAAATDKMANHRETARNLAGGKLLPLEEMAKVQIGSDPRTIVAYPAAGSFVQYLIEKYGLAKLKIAYQAGGKETAWTTAYNKPLADLEREWLEGLR